MSFRPLITTLTVLGLALGGTALATPGDAPLKKVQVDKTGNVTKTDGAVKKGDTKKAPPRKITTRRATPTRKGDKTLKPAKTGTVGKRPPMKTQRMKTQDIKPAPRVERGTKPTTGPAPTKKPSTSRVGAGDDEGVKTVGGKKPAAVKDAPAVKKPVDGPPRPAGPVKRAPK
ncbi:MAG: hypothetical protein CVU56_18105 [Deltaproteobacteria bacterium HGW-Deltaproteobacteria-14]|nr:MAG: hypothetical protein CVU56_18105 [Deltaproteobacteria bacterium HGW-Deltaproteobacteria-14]